jgi:hypothetical protein
MTVNVADIQSVIVCCTIAAMNPLSGVLGESWALYRAQARHLLTIAFIIYLITAIVDALCREIGGAFGIILGDLVTLIALYLLEAALVKAVQDVRDGRVDLSVGKTFSVAAPFLGPVAIASILASIAIAVGLALIIIPGLYLITIWCLIVPVIVLEGSGTFASFSRSYQLVRGNFWNVFGTLIVVFLVLFVLELVVGLILVALPVFLATFIADVIVGTLVAPMIAVVVTLMYFRLSAATAAGPAAAGGPYAAQGPYGAPGPFGGQPGQTTGFPPPGPADQGFQSPPPQGPPDAGFPPPAQS